LNSVENRDQDKQEGDFVELGGVAGDAVAEVDGPRESGGRTVGVVGEASEETSDASDGNAEGERDGIEVARGLAESNVALGKLDGDQAEGEGADDGFASDQVGRVMQAAPGELRVFEPEQELRAERGSDYCGGDDGPAKRGGEGVSETAAENQVDSKGD
jgi:hypothetical protein